MFTHTVRAEHAYAAIRRGRDAGSCDTYHAVLLTGPRVAAALSLPCPWGQLAPDAQVAALVALLAGAADGPATLLDLQEVIA